MNSGLAFLGGFIVGGFTVFIVTAVSVWRPIVEEWKTRFYDERKRRIEAESNSKHAYLAPVVEYEWGDPVDRTENVSKSQVVLDFTSIDDIPEA